MEPSDAVAAMSSFFVVMRFLGTGKGFSDEIIGAFLERLKDLSISFDLCKNICFGRPLDFTCN